MFYMIFENKVSLDFVKFNESSSILKLSTHQ